MISEEQLKQLEALERAATPGSWCVTACDDIVAETVHDMVMYAYGIGNDRASERCGSDANLIAASRNALPKLIDEVRRLRAALEEIADPTIPIEKRGGCYFRGDQIIDDAWATDMLIARRALGMVDTQQGGTLVESVAKIREMLKDVDPVDFVETMEDLRHGS